MVVKASIDDRCKFQGRLHLRDAHAHIASAILLDVNSLDLKPLPPQIYTLLHNATTPNCRTDGAPLRFEIFQGACIAVRRSTGRETIFENVVEMDWALRFHLGRDSVGKSIWIFRLFAALGVSLLVGIL